MDSCIVCTKGTKVAPLMIIKKEHVCTCAYKVHVECVKKIKTRCPKCKEQYERPVSCLEAFASACCLICVLDCLFCF